MNQYFFKMSQAEKNNILDQHKSVYDGFVTQYGQSNNQQPLYVQSYANDKGGLVVSNKGDVKPYTNMGINESFNHLDQIGDSEADLENGTVDLESEYIGNNDYKKDYDYLSLGSKIDDDEDDFYDELNQDRKFSKSDEDDDLRLSFINYNDDEDEIDFVSAHDEEISDEVPLDLKEDFNSKWVETLEMFNRIIK
jgi:hypothetical protein